MNNINEILNQEDKSFSESRRNFIHQLVLTSLACGMPLGFLQSCQEKENLLQFKGSGQVPFKIWEEMLLALKTSPDFHTAQVEKWISTKDTKAMYNYVRDCIALIPATSHFRSEGKYLKHGINGVLRTGTATAREKAELLTYMYKKAGFEAEVVREKTDFQPNEILQCYLRSYNNKFNPEISNEQLEKWNKELKVHTSEKGSTNNFDEKSQILVEKLISNFEINEALLKESTISWDNNLTPSVKFLENGKEKFAHLIDPKVPFGLLRKQNAQTYSFGKAEMLSPKLKLSIDAWHSKDLNQSIDLLSGEWDLENVLGRQINISFLKDLKLGMYSTKSMHQIQFYTPSFSLQGVDDKVSFLEEQSYLGNPITLGGEKILIEENDQDNFAVKLKYDKPVNLKSIAKIECKAKTINFPKVILEVNVKDANDQRIEGLQTNNFKIKEDGELIPAWLKSNQQSPKILVLSDTSLSMPITYRDEGLEMFNDNLSAAVLKKYPLAKFTFWQTNSDLYSWLLKASQESVDLIIYCTDGHVNDKFDKQNTAIYNNGAPALILDVLENGTTTFSDLANLTFGKVIPAKNQKATTNSIFEFLSKLNPATYVFEYNSKTRGEHTAQIEIIGKKIKNACTYKFNPKNDNEAGLISLYLNVQIGRSKYRKKLAGATLEEIEEIRYGREIKYSNRKLKNQVRGFLMGGGQLFVESEGPTLATALSDVLKAQLTNREWGEAFLENDIKLAKINFEKGTQSLSGNAISMMMQLNNAITTKSITYASGYRLSLTKTLWPIEDIAGSTSYDYFQTANYQTLGGQSLENFKTNAILTSQLAIRESVLFEENTYTSLQNKALISKQTLDISTDIEFLRKIRNRIYKARLKKEILGDNRNYIVFDKNLKSLSYWKINKKTGEIYGMLPDGTGGGNTPIPIDPSIEDFTSILLNIVAILEKIVLIASAGRIAMLSNPLAGVSLAIIAKYGVTLAKLYGIVTQTIVVMDATGMDEMIKKELELLACEVYKEIVFSMFGNAGATFAGLESLIGMLSPNTNNPFKCK